MADITSPRMLKLKFVLFLVLGLISSSMMLVEYFSLRVLILFAISIWAFCRAYYFCFYVLEHYVDPTFRYAGLTALIKEWVAKEKLVT